MAKATQIETETLRDWLDTQQPVTVLDIRTDEDRAQWVIPGSMHVNAYEALRHGQPGAFADLAIPTDRPVVTVCNAGKTSQTAADVLASRGFDARSLTGGMKAWSLAWNGTGSRRNRRFSSGSRRTFHPRRRTSCRSSLSMKPATSRPVRGHIAEHQFVGMGIE